ncbi:MAG: HD domain-containing protein [Pseudobutyrivibrio sp.]|nr:HD domain-containing protein [Pseudobutyrivibrio sp.]
MLELFIRYQLDIMLVLSSICGTIALLVIVAKAMPLTRRLTLLFLEITAMLLLFSDRLTYIFNGDITSFGFTMNRVSTFLNFLFTDIIVLAFNLYLIDLYINDGKMEKAPKRIQLCTAIMLVGSLLCVIGAYTGAYYTFDEANIYSRGDFYILSYLCPFGVPLIQLSAIIKYRSLLNKKTVFSNALFIIIPLLCSILQLNVYGTSFTNIGIIITAIFIYLVALSNINNEVELAKKNEIDYLKQQQKSMQRLFYQTASAFMGAIESKDVYTLGHSDRVANYAKAIALSCGKSERECDEIYYAALLHDIGKIGLPESILNKGGDLNEEEAEIYRRKANIGADILSNITEYPYLKDGAHYSNERYDGSGYPDHLKGEDIPEIGRIIAVADFYDNLTSRKNNREAYPQFVARDEILKRSGSRLDPRFATVMVSLIDNDKDYKLRESIEDIDIGIEEYLTVKEYRSKVTRGILIEEIITNVSFDWSLKVDSPTGFSAPSIIVFDSYDGRIHSDEDSIKAFGYLEFGEIWFNGHFNSNKAKNMEVTISQKGEGGLEFYGGHYDMTLARCNDHVKITVTGASEVIECMIALPENSKYAYVGITGEYCEINNISVEKTEEKFTEKDFIRIASAANYINRLEGDLPNIQIDRYRSASTEGVLIHDGLNVEFHTMSLPSANFVWNCPFVIIYSSDNGKIDGKNYLEYAMVQMNGEAKSDSTISNNDVVVKNTREFRGWDKWKEKNKEGMECHISFRISGNTLHMAASNTDFKILNTTAFLGMPENLYFALTGDVCAITDIRIYD